MNICMYIVNIYLETEFETLWLKERIENNINVKENTRGYGIIMKIRWKHICFRSYCVYVEKLSNSIFSVFLLWDSFEKYYEIKF